MAARLVLDVNRSPEPFVCWVSALGVKEAVGPLVTVVPYTFDHPNRRLIFLHWRISQRSLFWIEAFAYSRRTEVTHCPCMLGWSTLWGATHVQQTRHADLDRRCCIAHSLRLARVPCLTLTVLTSSIHLGIPNLGGRWPDASDIFFMCWVASRGPCVSGRPLRCVAHPDVSECCGRAGFLRFQQTWRQAAST